MFFIPFLFYLYCSKNIIRMKIHLPQLALIAFLINAGSLKAQLINSGFETWSSDLLVPAAMNPNSGNNTTGWWDYNYFNNSILGSSPISVTRCNDTVRTGNYSVRMQTRQYTSTSWNIYKTWGIPFIGHNYSVTLGILYTGNVNETTSTFYPGFPCTQKITQFKFYYQYKPNGNDTAECRVMLVNNRNPVAGGWFKTNVATGSSGWQLATVNLTYVNALTPDSLWILFSSSSLDRSPKPGSILWLDDASITLPIGIDEVSGEENKIDIFPNPSVGNFSVRDNNLNKEPQSIEVFNSIGEKVYSLTGIKKSLVDIDLTGLPKGIYFLKHASGEKIVTKKIVVQ